MDRFAPVWKQVALFMLRASGENARPEDVMPIFDKPETIQPRTEAETRQLNVNSGMPLVTVLRDEGKSQAYIDKMLNDLSEQEERKQTSLANSLLDAERKFNAGK